MHNHIVNHINNDQLVRDSTLHVVGVVTNPSRFHSRYRLFREWYERMQKTPNVKVYVVEAAMGDHHFECTERGNPNHLQLRTRHHLWFKENMINIGVRTLLPFNWKYLAWCDTDVTFTRDDWALRSLHKLQDYPLIQPWSEAVDLGANYNGMQTFESFCKLVYKGIPLRHPQGDPYQCGKRFGHSGYVWACTRNFYENTCGLYDKAILGSGDHNMAFAAIGKYEWSVHRHMGEGYRRSLREWQDKAFRSTHGHLAYVPGLIHHHFHGPKGKRFYVSRWQILMKNHYDPYKDLRYDDQGMLFIHGKPHLENDIRRYFHSRMEDSIEEV